MNLKRHCFRMSHRAQRISAPFGAFLSLLFLGQNVHTGAQTPPAQSAVPDEDAVKMQGAASKTQSLAGDRQAIAGPITLLQAIQIGLRESLLIRAAQVDVSAAKAETRVVRSQTRPQMSANAYLSAGDSANILYSAPGVMPTNYLPVPSQGFADANLTLMVPLYTAGRLNHLVRAAQIREQAANQDVNGVRAETILKIREAYDRALLAAENAKSAQARIDANMELVRTTQAQFEAGKGLEASVRRAESEQANAEQLATTARAAQEKALLDLKAAMGVQLASAISLADALTFSPLTGDLNVQLVTAQSRPELRAARARAQSFQVQTRAARAAQEPQVYGMAMADGFTSRPMGTRAGYTVGIVASFPLLDAGQKRAETAQSRAQAERAEIEARDMELRVANEVRQAWLDVQTAAQNYKTAQTALTAAQSAYDVAVLRVENYKGLLVEQLDALAALSQARANIAQSLYDHAIAVARLDRAKGRADFGF